jgi:hypothetical protein
MVAGLEAAGGPPDRDLVWRLATAVGADPMAPALLVAKSVRVTCDRGGWAGRKVMARGVEVRITYHLYAGSSRSRPP